jgi:predicted DNA-binding protein (MmcQ/YjbR family)
MESFEEEIFKGYKVKLSSLPNKQFNQEKEDFVFSSPIMNGDFLLQVEINLEGKVHSQVVDASSNSIYVLYKVPSASGEYVGKIRHEIRQTLREIRDKYFISTRYSPLILSLFSFIKDKYGEMPSYPFGEDDTAVFRHQKTKKWYGLILKINYSKIGNKDEVGDLLIVKGDVNKINHQTIFRGFHMNQKKWISYPLDGRVSLSELEQALVASYDKK